MSDQDRTKDQALHQATIDEWKMKKMRWSDQAEIAEKKLSEYLREALGDIGNRTRGNIAKQLINASQSGNASPLLGQEDSSGHLAKFRELDNDVVTGFEPLPWNRREK